MRPTMAIINLLTLDKNIRNIRGVLNPDTALMAVVKANAYGHGAVEIALQSIRSGAKWLGVALPEEGVELRKAGISCPILVLGAIDREQIDLVFDYEMSICLFSEEMAELLNNEGRKRNKKASVHIKLDTGMGRIGLRNTEDTIYLCRKLMGLEHIHLEGIFTHFAVADIADKTYTNIQLEKFTNALRILSDQGINFEWVHAANSAATIDCPYTQFNMVRAGISLYGYYPSSEVNRAVVDLKPILKWQTKVVQVKEIFCGESISYGRTFIADTKRKIATLPVGYGDGYNRLLSNRGWVLIKGKKAPIVGNICMDQMMVDVTHIPDVSTNEPVILIGKQGDEVITADDLAKMCNTISYEILTSIGTRVPRVYVWEEGV